MSSMKSKSVLALALSSLGLLAAFSNCHGQERLKTVYSSADATNFVWFAALDAGFYKKHGLDVELVFIPSSTTAASTVIAGDIPICNNSGRTLASAVGGAAKLVLTPCCINCLSYRIVVERTA